MDSRKLCVLLGVVRDRADCCYDHKHAERHGQDEGRDLVGSILELEFSLLSD